MMDNSKPSQPITKDGASKGGMEKKKGGYNPPPGYNVARPKPTPPPPSPKKKSTIEKLALKYFKHTGKSPEYGFWSWLEALGAIPGEEELKNLLYDKELWITLYENSM